MSRETRTMTMNEAGLYIAFVSGQNVEGTDLFPASMGTPYKGKRVSWYGRDSMDRWASGHLDDATEVQVDRAVKHAARDLTDGTCEVKEITYVMMITTRDLLNEWDRANEYGGPCLYWP